MKYKIYMFHMIDLAYLLYSRKLFIRRALCDDAFIRKDQTVIALEIWPLSAGYNLTIKEENVNTHKIFV